MRSRNGQLTDKQLELLMDCHERALMKMAPLPAHSTKGAKKLIICGYMEPVPFQIDRKNIMTLSVTTKGLDLLASI